MYITFVGINFKHSYNRHVSNDDVQVTFYMSVVLPKFAFFSEVCYRHLRAETLVALVALLSQKFSRPPSCYY